MLRPRSEDTLTQPEYKVNWRVPVDKLIDLTDI